MEKNYPIKIFSTLKHYPTIFSILTLCFMLCSCGIFVDTNTPKSEELSKKYNFYETSVTSIRTTCNVTPEEADEIFLVLVNDCGVDGSIFVTSHVNGPYSVKCGTKTLSMTLDGSTISEVFDGKKQIFPTTADDTSIPEGNNAPIESEDLAHSTSEEENVLTDRDVIKELKQSIEYYNSTVCTTLPLYAKKEDKEKVTELLTEAIATLDSDTDKYLQYMNNENLSDNVRQACQYLKTGFYGVSETALKPTLEIMNGNTEIEVPDYGTIVIDAQTMYIDESKKLIN